MVLLPIASASAAEAPVPDQVGAALGERLFPVLSKIDRSALPASTQRTLVQRQQRLAGCGEDTACALSASHWRDDQIAALAQAAAPTTADPSAVPRELRGVNAILEVYGAGAPARYPQIDGPYGAADSPRLREDALTALRMSAIADTHAAVDPSISLAIALLDVNDRLDAIAFEPINAGLNRDAFAAASTVDWQRYPYTAIIVLGAGPEDGLPLSAAGKLRIKAAAAAYRSGLAPLVIVSGGAVHPRGTKQVEAVQMRQALIQRFGLPAAAVLIEPYARHTTTNLRNAARLLFALDAPSERSALVVSSPEHLDYVAGNDFAERNRRELGYLPGTVGPRRSPFELAYRPATASRMVDPIDPLDP